MGRMGIFRNRDDRLPVYERASAKERLSDDGGYSTDDEHGHESSFSSRSASGSTASATPMISRNRAASRLPRVASVYPYRLPAKVTRYLFLGIMGLLVLLILSLVRASQVENWKVANGKTENRPPPPPVWERFSFLDRYYGGIRSLKPFQESRPQYPESDQQTVSSKDIKKDSTIKSQPWTDYTSRVQEEGMKECFLDAAGTVRLPQLQYYAGRPEGFPRHVTGSYDILGLPEDICFERYGRFGPYGFGYSVNNGGLGTGENDEKDGYASVWKTAPRVNFKGVNWADAQRRCYKANAARFKDLPAKSNTRVGFYIDDPMHKSNDKHKRDAAETADKPETNSTPAKDETPTKDKVAPKDETPAKDKAAPKDETPAKDKAALKDETPAKDKAALKDETPAKDKATVDDKTKSVPAEKKSRSAVVIRCFDEYLFREDDIAAIRALISELSLSSGGRYDIHLLVQVKNDAQYPIWADDEAYQKRIKETIPEEFRGLVTLWTETQMLSLYQGIHDLFTRGQDLPVHGVYRGLSMAMQYFAYKHPEYDYFWQWEMDVRYVGHYYDLFTKIEQWAKKQPRKGLWERNSRFYFPEVHGSWEEFVQMSRIQSEMGTSGADNVWKDLPGSETNPERVLKPKKSVWGPLRPNDEKDWYEFENDQKPPTETPEKDKSQWGVGEEADYISFSPMFDPEGTTWLLKDDITGYSGGSPIPRRANIITTSRVSRRLLMAMHRMTAYKKQFAFPEMWPATVALQHGMKAVYAPHPLYVDRKWPLEYMTQVYNGGRDGSSGGARASIFGEREHNFRGITWYYNSGFSPNLYRRWLGLRVNNDGGEVFETTEDQTKSGDSVSEMPGGEGRMCLPPMLLHPVKDVELPVEEPIPMEAPQEEGGSYEILDAGA